MKRAKRLKRARQLGVELLSVHAIRFQVAMQPLLILSIVRRGDARDPLIISDVHLPVMEYQSARWID